MFLGSLPHGFGIVDPPGVVDGGLTVTSRGRGELRLGGDRVSEIGRIGHGEPRRQRQRTVDTSTVLRPGRCCNRGMGRAETIWRDAYTKWTPVQIL